jgi:hypothetical protein
MAANAPAFENPLTTAAAELDDINCRRKLLTSSIDSGSIARMVAHITNINRSVLESTRDHVNASKRLNDFALTLTRIARKSEPSNEELATGLVAAASNLRSASDELANADAIPKWDAPVDMVPPTTSRATQ